MRDEGFYPTVHFNILSWAVSTVDVTYDIVPETFILHYYDPQHILMWRDAVRSFYSILGLLANWRRPKSGVWAPAINQYSFRCTAPLALSPKLLSATGRSCISWDSGHTQDTGERREGRETPSSTKFKTQTNLQWYEKEEISKTSDP